jgi:succinate dehydrogenase/fumarate reductase flavoprotein subunit
MIPWDETVDIAIGGIGAARLCAAIEARQRGASVKYTTGGLGINSKAR